MSRPPLRPHSGVCLIDDCGQPHLARGWCKKHYERWRVHGDPHHVEFIRNDHEARFWSYVQKGEACWEWNGGAIRGYGSMGIDHRLVLAHRFAYELLVGPIPDGLHIDHLCRNTLCVNPDHLEPVTPEENRRRQTLAGMGIG